MSVLALSATGLAVAQGSASAAPGDGTVQVRVVQDTGAGGYVVLSTSGADQGEQTALSRQVTPPLDGVAVTLTDADGDTMSAATDADGIASFDLASDADMTGGQYRVDVANPEPGMYYPGFAANNQEVPSDHVPFTAADGSAPATVAPVTGPDLLNPNNEKLSANTEFINVAGGATAYVNTSFWYPSYYCQDNAAICDAVQPWNAPPGVVSEPTDPTLFSTTYHLDEATEDFATGADTGAVYGIAYDRENQRIFSAAYAKRGSAYGPAGPGGIYVTDLSSTTYSLAGTTSQWSTVPAAGTDTHDVATNQDYGFFDQVGTTSLGDIDITMDGSYLFGVNQNNKTVFVYDLTDDSYQGSYPIPNPGCGDDWRPMGTGSGISGSLVGGVCAADSAPGDGTTGDRDALSAHVSIFDPATGMFGAQVVDQPLTYGRGIVRTDAWCNGAVSRGTEGRWFPWVTEFPSGPNLQSATGCDNVNGQGITGNVTFPEPMLDDIVEEINGDLVVTFRDRFGDQTGENAVHQNAAGNFVLGADPAAGGDIVRGCQLAGGGYVLDPNYDATTMTLAPGSVCSDNNVAGANNGGQSDTYREYYIGDWRTGFHREAFYGGMALSRSEPSVVSSGYDSTSALWTQGVSAVGRDGNLASGLPAGVLQPTTNNFGKGAGLADIEGLCNEAPIQIGNRVWDDTDGDGVQDAGEAGIAGVTMNLYDEAGTVVAAITTDDTGGYYFDNSTMGTDANGLPYTLEQDTDYMVTVDNPADYTAGGPLAGTTPTQANAGGDDAHDSDGTIPNGQTYAQVSLTTGGAGEDNHTYDFGFTSPVSIGDYLWLDLDGDGAQDSEEPVVPDGTAVQLLDANGDLVATDTTTGGYYSFTDLPPNTEYTIQFPTELSVDGLDYSLTEPSAGGDDTVDSNPDPATGQASVTTPASGGNLGTPGDADDPTIDAGYASDLVSVGDYVWIDADRDGVQDEGENPVADVGITLLDSDGEVSGTATTDEDGFYVFTDLPVNTDFTIVFPITVEVDGSEYPLTTTAAGDDAAADSNPDQGTGRYSFTTPATGNNSGEPGAADDPTIDAGYVAVQVPVDEDETSGPTPVPAPSSTTPMPETGTDSDVLLAGGLGLLAALSGLALLGVRRRARS